MRLDEWLLAYQDGSLHNPNGLVDWIFMMRGGDECADDAELIGVSFDNACLSLESVVVRIKVLMQNVIIVSPVFYQVAGSNDEIEIASLACGLCVHKTK